MTIVGFDIEADGYLYEATKIHCIALWREGDVSPYLYHGSKQVALAIEELQKATALLGHNITGYDIPLLKKLHGVDLSSRRLFDTYLMSCLAYPDNPHGHSIEAWALRLKDVPKKTPIEDWSMYTPEMGKRCIDDIHINRVLYIHFREKQKWLFERPEVLDLEQKVALIHAKQEQYGVRFDVIKALNLKKELDSKLEVLRKEITEGIPPKLKRGTTVAKPFKKDGSFAKRTIDALEWHVLWPDKLGCLPSAVGPFSKIEYEPFNLDSPKQVTEYLLSIGWKPTEWNYKIVDGRKEKTSPKLTEHSWGSLPGDMGRKIGEYRMLGHRRKWLLNIKDPTKGALATVRDNGRVPADALTCATPTSRYRHMGTVANIPKVSTPYGIEIRELLCVPSSKWMIGLDLDQIEARLLAHYCLSYKGGEELAEIILKGDFHQHNADFWEVDRDTAKGGLYALMYGCYPPKLADTLGKKVSEGQRLYDLFWDKNPAIKALKDSLERTLEAGKTVHSIDTRPLSMREKRKALNTLLQGSAAVVFKRWMVAIDEMDRRGEPEVHQIIAYHDELQFEYHGSRREAKGYGVKVKLLAGRVGKDLGIKVPITAGVKVGKNWRETH